MYRRRPFERRSHVDADATSRRARRSPRSRARRGAAGECRLAASARAPRADPCVAASRSSAAAAHAARSRRGGRRARRDRRRHPRRLTQPGDGVGGSRVEEDRIGGPRPKPPRRRARPIRLHEVRLAVARHVRRQREDVFRAHPVDARVVDRADERSHAPGSGAASVHRRPRPRRVDRGRPAAVHRTRG